MDTSYGGIIDIALDELTRRACREQRLDCPGFEESLKRHTKNFCSVEAVHARLDPDDRTALESFAVEEKMLMEQQMRYLYIQGAKDFVKLMRELGAL